MSLPSSPRSCGPASPMSDGGRRPQRKIVDKIRIAEEGDRPYYSFEYFPPKTDAGIENLRQRISRMAYFEPIFVDITWTKHARSMEVAKRIVEDTNLDVMMHLTMTDLSRSDLIEILDQAKDAGIRNILALRGDPPRGADYWEPVEPGLENAVDLVRLIREKYGDYFCVGVAGYPEGHMASSSLDEDLMYLKEKVDAGADMITTLLFYDIDVFFEFVERARKIGITVPIMPGLMPIQTYSTFVRIISFSNVNVPNKVWEELERIKDDDEVVKQFGIDYCLNMCREILARGHPGLHFYTLNLERSVTKLLERLDLLMREQNEEGAGAYPWTKSVATHRAKREAVRPIFWSNRNESYIRRTQHWDEFPNGRWGDNRSPAYGEFPDHHLMHHQKKLSLAQRRDMWGSELNGMSAISSVFVAYLNRNVRYLPWCLEPLREETQYLLEPLRICNRQGFLTINSQPRVNGCPSSDPVIGWGSPDGVVYQKAYLECFVSEGNLRRIVDVFGQFPHITFMAVNLAGAIETNCDNDHVNAVTWGVFPGREIAQPTIVDFHSFLAWKDEAFSLWKSYWQSCYEEGSQSYDLIETIYDNWYLLNIVDNDFVHGDIFSPFRVIASQRMTPTEFGAIKHELREVNIRKNRRGRKSSASSATSSASENEVKHVGDTHS